MYKTVTTDQILEEAASSFVDGFQIIKSDENNFECRGFDPFSTTKGFGRTAFQAINNCLIISRAGKHD